MSLSTNPDRTHPYQSLAPEAFWRGAVAQQDPAFLDPVGRSKFTLPAGARIMTAGSCFAQHIARHLDAAGHHHLVTESAHPLMSAPWAERYGYGLFTARYGNVYTARQMLQLLLRAYGLFHPAEDEWPGPDDSVIDPFRPRIQPGGFPTCDEFERDRAQHFDAIRRGIESLDCFIFTLGLTECWVSRQDGAVFASCPGVHGGRFDDDRHRFHNLTVAETASDLRAIIGFIRHRNPAARFILTVSPVPLAATATGQHVLAANTHSKSVLRAAAGEVAEGEPDIEYFPSYEVITGSYVASRYYAADLREVTDAGVAHVMRLFMQHYAGAATAPGDAEEPEPKRNTDDERDCVIDRLRRVICDEETLATFEPERPAAC